MTKTEYGKYLQSSHWRDLRKNLLDGEGYGSSCARCNIPRWLAEIAYYQDLHVHHNTYANLGSEEYSDLEILCRRCHEVETFGRSELRAVKRATCEVCSAIHWDYRSELCAMCEAIFGGYSTFSTVAKESWRLIAGRLAEFMDAEQFSREEFDDIISSCLKDHVKRRAEWSAFTVEN